jgi:hypothetical protein
MAVLENAGVSSALDKPTCIISCDTHVGPTMDQLRPYCQKEFLDDFDAFAREATALATAPAAGNVQGGDHREQMLAHVAKSGEHDPNQRLKEIAGSKRKVSRSTTGGWPTSVLSNQHAIWASLSSLGGIPAPAPGSLSGSGPLDSAASTCHRCISRT